MTDEGTLVKDRKTTTGGRDFTSIRRRRNARRMLVHARAASAIAAAAACLLTQQPALGANPAGAAIFESKCAACHVGGGNVINPGKTLFASAFEKNKYDTQEAVVNLVRNGKGQMPKYQGQIPAISKLDDQQLEDVAAYVLEQSAAGWPKS